MKLLRKINLIMALGTIMLLVGMLVIYDGVTRAGVLVGGERYFVGGLAVLVGLYFIFLGFKKTD